MCSHALLQWMPILTHYRTDMNNISFKSNNYIRSLAVIILGALLIGGIIYSDEQLNPDFKLSDIRVEADSVDDILATKELVDGAISPELYVDNQPMIYDYADNTFYYSTEGTTDESIIKVNHGRGIKIAITDDSKLVLYNHSRASVSNLVSTPLPIININVDASTVEELSLDETYAMGEYTGAQMHLYNGNDITDSDIKLHMRGGTTIDFPQKSYRITLLKKSKNLNKTTRKSLLGMREDDDWILYSAYSDYEKVRNVFSMNLWHEMAAGNNQWNAAVSNEYKYVELFFNGRYHGLYALTYPIDNKSFNISDGESLFKKKDWAGSEFSLELEPEDGVGYDWLPGYSLEDGDVYDYNTLHELYYNMAYSEDSDTIRQCVDMDNSIDLYLFYQITQAVDNVYGTDVKNLFTATKLSNNGLNGYKVLFAPWDMDQTWGNRYVDGEGKNGIFSYWNPTDYELPMEWGTVPFLINRGDPDIESLVKARYKELRDTVLSDENISEMIEKYEKEIYDSGAFERTMRRWPDGNYYDPSVKLGDFKNYVLERMKIMDGYFK